MSSTILAPLEWHNETRIVKDLVPYEHNPRILSEDKKENLIKGCKNERHLRYYKEMIEELQNPTKKRPQKATVRVYVGSLNKTFNSGQAASEALGRNRNYALRVINGIYPNQDNIKLL